MVNEGSGSVSIIETKTDEVSATINVGERPRGLAVSADGERLYVSREDGTLIERDMYAKAESGQAKLGRLPSSIDLSPDGKVLAAAIKGDGEIVLLDLATMRVVKKIPLRGGKQRDERCLQPGRAVDIRQRGGKPRASRSSTSSRVPSRTRSAWVRGCAALRSSREARARMSRPSRTARWS